MKDILLFATILAPIILALVQVAKISFNFKKTYIPLVAIVIGVLVGFFSGSFSDLDVQIRIWAGILGGLSSVGLFELVTPSKGNTKGGDK